jgi:hypothetical protein
MISRAHPVNPKLVKILVRSHYGCKHYGTIDRTHLDELLWWRWAARCDSLAQDSDFGIYFPWSLPPLY